ncbi:MAG: DoxX family protein [Akkermansiaceae bacterium]|nr:DoxX family protein [Akkermansiaceae bacterium]
MTASKHSEGSGDRAVVPWITLSLRVLLGAWFLFSGGVKLWSKGVHAFATDIANYRLLPDALVLPAAHLVPWLEVFAGLCLMLGFWRRGSILVIGGLVISFIVFIGWAWAQQLDISCGCQSSDEPIRYWFKAVELPAYLLVLAWLWFKDHATPGLDDQKVQNMA